MHNAWMMRASLDPATLSALSATKAVARICDMPDDDAVDFFAKASADDAREILSGLLRADEPKAVSILADLNPRRAGELIQPLVDEFPWLEDLSEAADAIVSCAAALELGDHRVAGRLARAAKALGGRRGYVRRYEKGVIYWSEGIAGAISGQIAEYHETMGGSAGSLGFPLAVNANFIESQYGVTGEEHIFQGGIVCSSNLGTYEVAEPFHEVYRSSGGAKGWLGFPTSAPESDGDAEVQCFEGGVICSSARGVFPVRQDVAECADGWLPESEEAETEYSHVSRHPGKVQRFWCTPGVRFAIYSSKSTGIQRVGWKILRYYESKGGPVSRLGFPVAEVTVVAGQGYYQEFEGGRLYFGLASSPVMVPAATVDVLRRDAEVEARLGWPKSEEETGRKNGEGVQGFENGIVTRRGRTSKIYLSA